MKNTKTIACFGGGSCTVGSPEYQAAYRVGWILAACKCTVVNGGAGGVMKASAQGANENSGVVVGYTLLGLEANEYLTKEVNCQTEFTHRGATNDSLTLEEGFGVRLGSLLKASYGFIVIPGGPGTLLELLATIAFNAKPWKDSPKKVAILNLKGDEEKGGAWNNSMLVQLEAWGMLPHEVQPYIRVATTPEEAVAWVTS